jgi:twinkle protein
MKTFADYGIDTRGRTTGNVKVICPQCSHQRRHRKEPCLSVDVERGVWKCHHCGWAGHLGGDAGPAFSSERRVYTKPDPTTVAGVPLDGDPLSWLMNDRRIGMRVLLDAGVTTKPNEILFPYRVNGELINIKHRRLGEKQFWMESGCELVWYGLDWCRGAETVYVVEGEIDALTMRQAGYKSVLSTPNGAPPIGTAARLDYFASGVDIFEAARTVVLAGDGDAPGQSLTAELARRIGVEKCKRVQWPDGIKDANECLAKLGSAALTEAVDGAIPYPIAGIITADDELDEVLRLHREGMPRGLSTGWASLDNLFSVVPGYFTVITGIPGSGKSEFADNVMVNLSRQHGWRWLVFSPEGAPTPSHIGRLCEKYWGKPFLPFAHNLHSGTPRMTEEEVMTAHAWVNEHVQFAVPEEPTIDEILRLARADVLRRGTQGIVIDPWNEIQHSRPSSMREDEYLSDQLRKVRQFAERHQCHVFVVNHPHAMAFDPKTGQYPVVKGYDLNGGAMWLNKAGGLLSVWRDAQQPDEPVKVYVLKTKTRQIGRRGVAKLWFLKPTGRYQDANDWEVLG